MTQRDVLEQLRKVSSDLWLDLTPLGRWLILRCLRALEADVALEEARARKAAR